MEGTRAKILDLLQREGQETVDGLAKSLGLTSATIRRHLDILQRDRLIGYEEVRKKTGRPEYSFSLTEGGHEALPKRYHRMLNLLLKEISHQSPEEIGNKSGREILSSAFQRIGQEVVGQHEKEVDGKGLPERLAVLLNVLQDEDFFPEAEDSEGVIRIRLLNCPFRYAALDNKVVCDFDSTIISTLLQAPITHETCIQNGDRCCTYLANVGA